MHQKPPSRARENNGRVQFHAIFDMYVIDCASVDMMRMRQIFMTACVCGTRVDETYIVYALEERACSDLFLLLQPRPRAFMI